MKNVKIIGLTLVAFILISCNNTSGNKPKNIIDTDNEKVAASKKIKPEYLTYETFKQKVWNFEKNPQVWIYEGELPCVIDFYADWCKPCRMIAPIMIELAKKYEGKVLIYKIDTQKEKELAKIFQIRSIPAVLFSPLKGKPMMQAGALPKDMYIKIIEENLLNPVEIK